MIDSIIAKANLLGVLVLNHGFVVKQQRHHLDTTISKIKQSNNQEKQIDLRLNSI